MTARAVAGSVAQRSALLWLGSSVVILCVAAGAAVSRGQASPAFAAVAIAAAFVAGIVNWRRHAYALLVFLPFSGIPIVALYPHTSVGVLAGDVLFVLPAYVGFLTEFVTQRKQIAIDGIPTALLTLLAFLVLVQALNPGLPNLLVGMIGIKTWLFYIPLLFVGYHLIASERDLFRVLTIMAAAAIVPVVLGIGQGALISSGHANLAYRPYGPAAAAVSQNFAQFDYGTGTLGRAPSTFSFVTQYYLFTAAMIAVTYALWRGRLAGTGRQTFGRLLWLLMLAGAFLTGSRGAFLMIPVLVLMIVLLERGAIVPALARVAAPALVLIGAGAVIGAAAFQLVQHAFVTAGVEANSILVEGIRRAFDLTWVGLGSGIDSSGSRYVLPTDTSAAFITGPWTESWYVKVVLELGVPGLCLVGLLVATLVVGGVRRHRLVRDRRLRAVSAALLAFLLWILLYGLKGKYIDLDPANVYFWLFAGVLVRTWALDRQGRTATPLEAR